MKEAEIRPQELFNRYLEVVRQDIQRFFGDKKKFVEIRCPGCNSDRHELAFDKLGFLYQTCQACGTLFLSPRPSSGAIDDYYQKGDAVKFWSTNFYKETAEARREKIYRPRAQMISEAVRTLFPSKPRTFVDVGAGYGIFLEEISRSGAFQEVLGIEPAPNMAEESRKKGFRVIQKTVESVQPKELQADFVTTFEVLEHVFSPEAFLRSIFPILKPGGILLFTTLTNSGFDLQVLGEHSKSVYPPHHINLISVEGMKQLIERCGYQLVELSTPGKLDLDIVINAVKENPKIPLPPFVRYLIESRGEKAHQAFQNFLQEHCLSSHIRCIVKKTP